MTSATLRPFSHWLGTVVAVPVLIGTVVGKDGHADRHKCAPVITAGALMALPFHFLP